MTTLPNLLTSEYAALWPNTEKSPEFGRNMARIFVAEHARREELELAHQALSAIFNNIPDGLVVLDDSFRIQHANLTFCQWVGLNPEVITGRQIDEVLQSSDLSNAIHCLETDPASPTTVDVTITHPIRRLLQASIAQLKAGQIQSWIISFSDQSERRSVEYQKIEFINIASHELRTPLTAIIGFSDLLQQYLTGRLPDYEQECLNGITRGVRRLKDIIDEMLAFAQLNQGEVHAQGIVQFDLGTLISEIIAAVAERAQQRGITIQFTPAESTIPMLANAALLRSALTHLLLNAITFNNPGGRVAILASVAEQLVTIRIEDTGIGIAPDELEAIFQPIYQVEDHCIRRVGGMGLGLSITRRSIVQLGGTLHIESHLGAGTTCTVQMPIQQPSPQAELEELRARLAATSQRSHAYACEAQTLYAQLQRHLVATLTAISTALEARDTYTRGHSDRVTALALRIAQQLGYSERELQILEISGHIHDIGMIGVPDSILNKIDQLTDEEAALMHQHVALGRTIIERLEFLNDVIPGAFAHHERWDGAGYPDGLAGDAIPLDGRILAVADAYDAMTSPRPYRQAMTDEQARAIIRTGAGSQWDPTVVQAFLAIIDQPIES